MPRPRRSAATSTYVKAVGALVAGLTLVVGIGVAWGDFRESTAVPRGDDLPPAMETVRPDEMPWPKQAAPLAESLARLADRDRPYAVAVIGDSTGISEQGWQRLLVTWMGRETDRSVVLRQWQTNTLPESYYDPNTLREGRHAPITLWNASAGGKDFGYTISRQSKLFPEDMPQVDLLIVNHGHNVTPAGEYFGEGEPFVRSLVERWPGAAVVAIKQNPEAEQTGHGEEMRWISSYIDGMVERSGATAIDVHAAFEATGDPLDLIDETFFHPTAAGYRLWFETMRDVFDPLMPTS